MKIAKAVITAAGSDQRSLPLQTLVDRDGRPKAALAIIVEEAVASGIEELAVVVHPGDADVYGAALGDLAGRVRFIEQHGARGYGHALHLARDFVGREPVLHFVSDHLCVSGETRRCAAQLMERAAAESCAVSAVQATRENTLPLYGVAGGRPVTGGHDLYEIERVVEKPTPTQAEQELMVPGLRAGYYLCFFGMHVLTPLAMDLLGRELEQAADGTTVSLSPALAALAERERYLAFAINGQRYNIGVQYGLFLAQLALILKGNDREEVLAQMVELLATRGRPV